MARKNEVRDPSPISAWDITTRISQWYDLHVCVALNIKNCSINHSILFGQDCTSYQFTKYLLLSPMAWSARDWLWRLSRVIGGSTWNDMTSWKILVGLEQSGAPQPVSHSRLPLNTHQGCYMSIFIFMGFLFHSLFPCMRAFHMKKPGHFPPGKTPMTATPFWAMLSLATLSWATVRRHAVLSHAVRRHAVLSHAVLNHAVFCHAAQPNTSMLQRRI